MSKTLAERVNLYAAFVLMERGNKAIDAGTLASKIGDFGTQCSVDFITHTLPCTGFYDVKDDMYSPYSQGRKLYALNLRFYKEMKEQTKEIASVKTDDEIIGFIKAYKLCRTRPWLTEIFNRTVESFTGSRSGSPQKSPQAHQGQN